MVFPPYAAPFPDTKDIDLTLGAQHRAVLTLMAQRPGHVFTTEELAAKLKLPALTPRRAEVLVGDINEVLGDDTIATVPRRGWKMTWYEHEPVTLSF